MICCGSKTGTICAASCGKGEHQVCTTAADCAAGDYCKHEAGGYGLCEHPHTDAGTPGDGGSSSGSDSGPSDATAGDDGGG
jgi:hypothetical protein